MITLHALQYSRAFRVVWLMNNLDVQCKRVDYPRTEEFRAPDDLKAVHPLGKSPVIDVDGNQLAESAAILRFLDGTHGDGRHQPKGGSEEYWRHEALLDYVEGSFAPDALRALLPLFSGKSPSEGAVSALNTHLDYLAQMIGDGPYLCGDDLTLADIQVSYQLANLDRPGLLDDHPVVKTYWRRLQDHPGYIAAKDQMGPMAPPPGTL